MPLSLEKNLGTKVVKTGFWGWGGEWNFEEIRVRREKWEGLGSRRESMVMKQTEKC